MPPKIVHNQVWIKLSFRSLCESTSRNDYVNLLRRSLFEVRSCILAEFNVWFIPPISPSSQFEFDSIDQSRRSIPRRQIAKLLISGDYLKYPHDRIVWNLVLWAKPWTATFVKNGLFLVTVFEALNGIPGSFFMIYLTKTSHKTTRLSGGLNNCLVCF